MAKASPVAVESGTSVDVLSSDATSRGGKASIYHDWLLLNALVAHGRNRYTQEIPVCAVSNRSGKGSHSVCCAVSRHGALACPFWRELQDTLSQAPLGR